MQFKPLPKNDPNPSFARSVGSWVLTVEKASSKHSWRTVFPLVLRINNVLHLAERNQGGSRSPVGDGDDEDEGLHYGAHTQEKSALGRQCGVLLAPLLALVACGR